MFLADWWWFANGIRDAGIPNKVHGWISMYLNLVKSPSYPSPAISSSTILVSDGSKYSTKPFSTSCFHDLHLRTFLQSTGDVPDNFSSGLIGLPLQVRTSTTSFDGLEMEI